MVFGDVKRRGNGYYGQKAPYRAKKNIDFLGKTSMTKSSKKWYTICNRNRPYHEKEEVFVRVSDQ